MNSALKAWAISRASVVLPTPGGPHSSIECGLPGRKGDRERLAGGEQMPLPDHLVDRLGTQPVGERRCGIGGGEEIGHDALTRPNAAA